MRKLLSLLVGFGLGALIGAALVMLLAPQSGEQLVASLKRGWEETMDEARKAGQQKRIELQAELAAKRLKRQN
jgi:gas vesicle protein